MESTLVDMDLSSLSLLVVIASVALVLIGLVARIVQLDGRGWRPPPASRLEHETMRSWPR